MDWADLEEPEGSCVSEEAFAKRLWREILEKKGLPSDTPYTFIPEDDYLNKHISKLEDKCDMVMRAIRQKKQSAKTTPTSSKSSSSSKSAASTSEDEEIQRKRKKNWDKNRKKRENKKIKKKAAPAKTSVE